MNPQTELDALVRQFPGEPFLAAEHVAASLTPEPYRSMLAHDRHMTLAMEAYHGSLVDVKVLADRLDGDTYARKILLTTQATGKVVQYGIIRFDLTTVSDEVRREILAKETPLGRILINHNVLRIIDLGAILLLTLGQEAADAFGLPVGTQTYGRLATIFCNGQAAVDLLEVSTVLDEAGDRRTAASQS